MDLDFLFQASGFQGCKLDSQHVTGYPPENQHGIQVSQLSFTDTVIFVGALFAGGQH